MCIFVETGNKFVGRNYRISFTVDIQTHNVGLRIRLHYLRTDMINRRGRFDQSYRPVLFFNSRCWSIQKQNVRYLYMILHDDLFVLMWNSFIWVATSLTIETFKVGFPANHSLVFWQMWWYDWKRANKSNERALVVSFWILVLSGTLSACSMSCLTETCMHVLLCKEQRIDTWINDRFGGTSPEASFCSHYGSRMEVCFVTFVALCITNMKWWNVHTKHDHYSL